MTDLINGFMADVLADLMNFFDMMSVYSMDIVMHAETKLFQNAVGQTMLTTIIDTIQGVGISFIIVIFIKKGFECYVLWTDGDPDSDPTLLLTRFIVAIVIAVSFPYLYTLLTSVTTEFATLVFGNLNSMSYDISGLTIGTDLLASVCYIVFFVCAIILYFQFMMKGIEVMILRMGVPLACIGFLNNDKGVWAEYSKMFIKAMLTIVIQIFLLRIAFTLAIISSAGSVNLDTITGIACCIMAIKTPKFLNQFIIPGNGGGGAMNKAVSGMHLINMIKR